MTSRDWRITVVNSTVEGNGGGGIHLWGAYSATIVGNDIWNNADFGINCSFSRRLTVLRNDLRSNDNGLIFVECDDCEIAWNTVAENHYDGINLTLSGGHAGIHVHNNTISKNGLLSGWGAGVALCSFASYHMIEHNLLTDNAVGIMLSTRLASARDNVIRFNVIHSSSNCGVYESGHVKTNLFYLNEFYENQAHVRHPDIGERFDNGSLGNFWDDYTARYPDAKVVGAVWDTPYEVQPGSKALDFFPLAYTYERNPPIAMAGPDRTVGHMETVVLSDGGSTDDSAIAKYIWTIRRGGGLLGVSKGESVTTVFPNLGQFMITLTVVDVFGNWASDEFVITVVDRTPPVADAGEDLEVPMGDGFTLDGSASSDNVGIVRYQWIFERDGVELEVLEGSVVVHWFDDPGVYTAMLVVLDGVGLSGFDHVNITVRDTEAPVARAGPDAIVGQLEDLEFDGTLSTDNVGIVNYTWTFTVGSKNLTRRGPSFQILFEEAGVYEVKLTVTDVDGNWDEDRLLVEVFDTTPPHLVPLSDVTVGLGVPVIIDVSGSTDNVGIVKYSWRMEYGEDVLHFDGAVFNFTFDEVGEYIVWVSITDARGNGADNHVDVSVLDTINPTAVIEIGSTVVEAGTNVTFSGGMSTDNVGVVAYKWWFLYGGKLQRFDGPSGWFHFERPGEYVINLTVTDADGNEDTASWTLTVVPFETKIDGGVSPYWVMLVVMAIAAVLAVLYVRRTMFE
jgi:parallel beta-helix repeat protein